MEGFWKGGRGNFSRGKHNGRPTLPPVRAGLGKQVVLGGPGDDETRHETCALGDLPGTDNLPFIFADALCQLPLRPCMLDCAGLAVAPQLHYDRVPKMPMRMNQL